VHISFSILNDQDMQSVLPVLTWILRHTPLARRAEQHRLRVASLGKLREELQLRQAQNKQARARLEENAEWRRLAMAAQVAWTRRPTATNIVALNTSTQLINASSCQGLTKHM
jgi:hypothetical protein